MNARQIFILLPLALVGWGSFKAYQNFIGMCATSNTIMTDDQICRLSAARALKYNNANRISTKNNIEIIPTVDDLLRSPGWHCSTNARPNEGLPPVTFIDRAIFGMRMIVIVEYVEKYKDQITENNSRTVSSQYYISNCGTLSAF